MVQFLCYYTYVVSFPGLLKAFDDIRFIQKLLQDSEKGYFSHEGVYESIPSWETAHGVAVFQYQIIGNRQYLFIYLRKGALQILSNTQLGADSIKKIDCSVETSGCI